MLLPERSASTEMKLEYKPDFEGTARRWDAFWQKEIIDRPCLSISFLKEGAEEKPRPIQLEGLTIGYREAAEMYDAHAASRQFLAEAVPYFFPSFGPDQMAAFFGANLKWSPDSEITNWAEPIVDDWEEFLPIEFDPGNAMWQGMLEYQRVCAEVSEGKFLISQMDWHSNMDLLLAFRGGERLCIDLIECPDLIEQAMLQARSYYVPLYDAVYEAGRMQERGTIGWAPFYTRGKFATIQCDAFALFGPAMGRRFVIPALEEEAAFLDHCVLHFDGPDALPHLDDVCAIEEIDVIQWVQGAGSGRHLDWLDLLKEIQAKGKGLEVHGSADECKTMHRELKPEGVLYCVGGVKSEREGHDLIEWFRRNT